MVSLLRQFGRVSVRAKILSACYPVQLRRLNGLLCLLFQDRGQLILVNGFSFIVELHNAERVLEQLQVHSFIDLQNGLLGLSLCDCLALGVESPPLVYFCV